MFEWQVEGKNNENFVPCINKPGEGLLFETANNNEQISISGTAVSALFGYVKIRKGNTQIKGRAYGAYMVKDEQVNNTDVYQMWKRLGDCSTTNKTLSVTVGETTQTYTFNQDYSSLKTAEEAIISAVNSVITIAVLKKYKPDSMENIVSEEKTYVIPSGNGLLAGQLITKSGAVCSANCQRSAIYGYVLEDGIAGELTQIWTGNELFMSGVSGVSYGVGADGKFSADASVKVGEAVGGVFAFYD